MEERIDDGASVPDQALAAAPSSPVPGLAPSRFDPSRDGDDFYDNEIGCVNCDSGWRHGCCDDLCRGSNEPEWCDYGRPCRDCNPHGEVL